MCQKRNGRMRFPGCVLVSVWSVPQLSLETLHFRFNGLMWHVSGPSRLGLVSLAPGSDTQSFTAADPEKPLLISRACLKSAMCAHKRLHYTLYWESDSSCLRMAKIHLCVWVCVWLCVWSHSEELKQFAECLVESLASFFLAWSYVMFKCLSVWNSHKIPKTKAYLQSLHRAYLSIVPNNSIYSVLCKL